MDRETDRQTDRQTVIWQGPVVRNEESQVDIHAEIHTDTVIWQGPVVRNEESQVDIHAEIHTDRYTHTDRETDIQ